MIDTMDPDWPEIRRAILASLDAMDPRLVELVRTLYARRDETVEPQHLRPVIPAMPDWRPEPNNCFDNVLVCTRHIQGCTAVPGFTIFDWRSYRLPVMTFQPHLVVRDAAGTLIDVTPHGLDYPYIPHTGGADLFQLAVETSPVNGLPFWIPPGD
jgi:hypothetical protein